MNMCEYLIASGKTDWDSVIKLWKSFLCGKGKMCLPAHKNSARKALTMTCRNFQRKTNNVRDFWENAKTKTKKIEKNVSTSHERTGVSRCVCECVWVLGNCARMEKLWNHHEKRCKFFPLPPRRTATCAADKASYKWMSWVSEWMHGGVSEWMREEWVCEQWVSECMSAATCGKDNKCCWSKWKISVCALFAHSLPPFPRLLDCFPPPPPLRIFQPAFPFVCAILFAFAAAAAQRKHSIFIRFCICSQRESFSGIFMGALPLPH